jgi:hypothetical protein
MNPLHVFFPREKIHDWGHVSSYVCPSPYGVHGKYLKCAAGGYGLLAESMALGCAMINNLRSALIVLGVSGVSTSVSNRGHDEREGMGMEVVLTSLSLRILTPLGSFRKHPG